MVAIAAVEITLTQRRELKSIVVRRGEAAGLVRRARVILLTADGVSGKDIAKRLNLSAESVSRIRARFLRDGVEGLNEKAKAGRKDHAVPAETVERIAQLVRSPPPPGRSRWTTRLLGKEVGLSSGCISDVFKREGWPPLTRRHNGKYMSRKAKLHEVAAALRTKHQEKKISDAKALKEIRKGIEPLLEELTHDINRCRAYLEMFSQGKDPDSFETAIRVYSELLNGKLGKAVREAAQEPLEQYICFQAAIYALRAFVESHKGKWSESETVRDLSRVQIDPNHTYLWEMSLEELVDRLVEVTASPALEKDWHGRCESAVRRVSNNHSKSTKACIAELLRALTENDNLPYREQLYGRHRPQRRDKRRSKTKSARSGSDAVRKVSDAAPRRAPRPHRPQK